MKNNQNKLLRILFSVPVLSIIIFTFFLFIIFANLSFSSIVKDKVELDVSKVSSLPNDDVQLENNEESPHIPANENNLPHKIDSIIDYANSLKGVPYKWAGKSPEGFDCSGFIFHVFKKHGIDLPSSSVALYTEGESILKDELQKGDLVFFTGTKISDHTVGHVGIIISEPEEDLQFIHSSSGGGGRGVTVNDLDHPHYQARYLGGRRIDM